jgi:hypothetical protein
MPESNTVTRGNGQRTRRPTSEPAVALQRAVSDQPWLMMGAATGAGLTLGLQSRRLAQSHAVGMFLATIGGIAVRVATNALVEWLQMQQQRRR